MGILKPHSNGPLYSNTVIGTLAVDGWAVTFGTARRGLGGLRPRPVSSSLYQVYSNGLILSVQEYAMNVYIPMLISLFLVFTFLFLSCGLLRWLSVSFLLHAKYTLSYCIVYVIKSSLSSLLSSMRGRQQLSCLVLRPPSRPNARPQDNIHLT